MTRSSREGMIQSVGLPDAQDADKTTHRGMRAKDVVLPSGCLRSLQARPPSLAAARTTITAGPVLEGGRPAAWIAKEKLRHGLNLRARVTGPVPCAAGPRPTARLPRLVRPERRHPRVGQPCLDGR
jgi:hypothetical protein